MGPLDRLYGLVRSLWLYHGGLGRRRRLDRFYAGFVPAGGLAFDIGAHVGDRSLSWARLGAKVVAVEPQPDLARFLRWLFRGRPELQLVEAAVAASPGSVRLLVSPRTPTVSTASPDFVAEATRVASFAWVRWPVELEVPAMTLDRLIERFGVPDFVKIDVEGFEDRVLAGLGRPLRALSFEFVPASLGSALASINRLERLAAYRYNMSLGESLELVLPEWVEAAALRDWLGKLSPESGSGDVYARLPPQR